MKINKIFSQVALTIGTALAVIICPSERLLAQAEASIAPALPKDIAFTFSISTKPETWQDLNRFHLFRELYLAASNDLSLPEGLDLQTDILSWLGDRSHVVVLAKSGNGDPETELTEKLLVVVPIKDDEKYAAYWQKLTIPLIERDYRGITIQEDRDTTSPDCKLADQSNSQGSPWEGSPLDSVAPLLTSQAKQLPTPSADATGNAPSEPPPSCINFVAATVPGYAVYALSARPIEAFIDSQVEVTPIDSKLMRTLQRAEMPNSLVSFYADIPKFVDWVKAFALIGFPSPGSGNLEPIEEDVQPQPPTQPKPRQLAQSSAPPQANPGAVPSPVPPPLEPEEPDLASEYDPTAAIDRAFKPLLQDYDSIDLFVLTQPEGIRVKSSVYYKEVNPERADPETLGANGILRRVPGSTYTSINSRNLRQRWEKFLEFSEGDKELEAAADLLRTSFKASTGLDLEKDVLAWLDGEYAGFIFPTRKGLFGSLDPTFQLGMGLMFQTSDRPAAEVAIRKLEDAVVFKFGEDFNIKRRTIAGRTVTSWEFALLYGDDPSVMAYTWADADTLLITQSTELMVELLEPRGKLLPGYYTFNTATDSLPRPNQGYAYMNMGSVLALVNTMVPAFIRADGDFQLGMRILATIRSFSTTSSTTADRDQGDALVVLAPILPKQEAQVGRLAEKLRQRIGSFAP